MSGHPRYQIEVAEHVFELAHAHARRVGFHTTSDWLRALLLDWDDEPLTPRTRRSKELSVRLSPPLQARLETIAQVSGTSLSEAFAILVERALFATAEASPARKPKRKRATKRQPAKPKKPRSSARVSPTASAPAEAMAPELPAPDDHARWAREIQDAARRTARKFGRDKAFIAGVLDELIKRFQPRDTAAFRAMVRDLLPVLNRMDRVQLSRADLVASMDPQLVRDSHIQYLNADFHFVSVL